MRRAVLLACLSLLPACGGDPAPAPARPPVVTTQPSATPDAQQAACASLTQVRGELAALQDQVLRAQGQGTPEQAAPLQARLDQLRALEPSLRSQCEQPVAPAPS